MAMLARHVVIGLAGSGLLAALVAAAPQQPVFRADVDVVTLDVTVLDRNRRPVRGLTAEDFVVVDGDERLPVAALTEINLPPVQARSLDAVSSTLPPDVATNDVAEGRLVTIMFDHSISAGRAAESARRIAREVVAQLGPADRAAIVFSDRALSQSFTTDRALLLETIDRPEIGTSLVQGQADADYEIGLCRCGVCSVDTITRVARTVMDVPERRKALVFIGGYLPTDGNAIDPKNPCQPWQQPAMLEMFEATQRANLTLYLFDPNGLVTPTLHTASSRLSFNPTGGMPGVIRSGGQTAVRSPEALLTAADHTGGRAFMNTNAPERRVTDVLVETGNYYVLGFTPRDGGTAGEFRRVRVEVNRRGVEVLARRGYYVPDRETPAEVSPASIPDRLQAALEGLLPQARLRLRLNAFPVARAGGTSLIGMAVGIEPSTTPAVRRVLAGVFDANGHEVGRASLRVESAPLEAADVAAVMDDVFLHLEVPKPGQYHVRVAVDEADTGRVASVYDIIDVPDFERTAVSLSGLLVFTESGRGRTVAASGPFPQAPTTRRTFARAERVAASVQVVQRRDRPLVAVPVTVRVLDAQGATTFERVESLSSDSFDTAGQAMYTVVVPTDALETGAYTLVVEATQGRARATRSAQFEIDP